MKIIDRYLAKQVILAILVVSVALLGFDLFFNLVHELKVVGRGSYTLGVALQYLALIAPTRLYAMFPWSALIGTLISLGFLANHSELVVLRTAGLSVFRISVALLKGAMILLIFVLILGEGIAPTTERLGQNKRMSALSGGQTIQTLFGIWVRQGNEFIHIHSVLSDDELIGVTCYQFDDNRKLMKAFYAQSAKRSGDAWQLNHVQGTKFLADKTEVFKAISLNIPQVVETEILEAAMVKHPERLSLIVLWRTIEYRTQNELNTQVYKMALWTKLLQPVVILMMVLLAIPFTFGPLRSVSMGFRVVAGILVAFSFHTLNNFLVPLAVVYQFPPFLAVLLPILIFGMGWVWLMKKVK